MSILIKGVLLNDSITDILIEGKRIKRIAPNLDMPADRVISGEGKAAIPGFVNTHTHAAMTLFRGYGDDMALMPWLEQKIWPNEAKLTHEDIYWGAKLACLEMIKSGTTTFFDMYHQLEATAEAVEEMGIRGVLSQVYFDHFNPGLREKAQQRIHELDTLRTKYSDRIQITLGPHAIYTVSGELLQWLHHHAKEQDMLIHLHLAETKTEWDNCVKQFGVSPVRYLHRRGVLSPRLLIAHGIYVDNEEVAMLADAGVMVAHNPASNMKLASGYDFKFKEMKEAGIAVGIGTDGCSSSNNLDMVEAMKLALFMDKVRLMVPDSLTANDAFHAATEVGASMTGWHTGKIEEGYLADLSLVDLRTPAFAPNFNFISNLVYAANGSCIDTVICDGKLLMENRKVPGELEIIEKASHIAYDLMSR